MRRRLHASFRSSDSTCSPPWAGWCCRCPAGAADRVTLYAGNDDHIVLDLLTPFPAGANGGKTVVRIKGGLLGHWSVWAKRAVELLERIHASVASGAVPADLLALDAQVTDCNAAIFDV